MDDIKPSLINFIRGEDFWQNILVVESFDYLEPLRKKFPSAEIFFVTANEDFHFEGAKTFVIDYREERLPFDEEVFDVIVGDLTLEVVTNPQDIAAGFSTYIKQTGCWVTIFLN